MNSEDVLSTSLYTWATINYIFYVSRKGPQAQDGVRGGFMKAQCVIVGECLDLAYT